MTPPGVRPAFAQAVTPPLGVQSLREIGQTALDLQQLLLTLEPPAIQHAEDGPALLMPDQNQKLVIDCLPITQRSDLHRLWDYSRAEGLRGHRGHKEIGNRCAYAGWACVIRLVSSLSKASILGSACFSSAILLHACMTVVWSRPPRCPPISSRLCLVSVLARYMQI